MRSRCEILLETLEKVYLIEAKTMLDMISRLILPAADAYSKELAEGASLKKSLGIEDGETLKRLAALSEYEGLLCRAGEKLKAAAEKIEATAETEKKTALVRDELTPAMAKARAAADELEKLTAESYWPYPTYTKLLFSV